MKRARKRAVGRYELLNMDAHMRADIGASPGEAHFEGSRAFWDAHTPRDPSRRRRGGL